MRLPFLNDIILRKGGVMGKKLNAVLSLGIIASVLTHIVYEIIAYLTFYYNPALTKIIAFTTLGLAGLHALCSAGLLFFAHDRGNGMRYPKLNARTLIQRVSAAAMVLMIVPHINNFKILSSLAGSNRVLFYVVLFSQLLFYAAVLIHVAVSVSRAFISLGLVSTGKAVRAIDVTVWILCAVLFAAASVAVLRTQISMFAGGAS